MTRPVVGQWRSAPDNAPRTPAPAPSTPPEAPEVDLEAARGAPLDESKEKKEPTAFERYQARLKEVGLSLEDAKHIMDTVFEQDVYEEEVRLRGQRLVLRTRRWEDHERLKTAFELERPHLGIAQEDLVNRYNLAASLAEWKGVRYRADTEEDFARTLAAVRKFPQPVIAFLLAQLSKFDTKMLAVFDEGALENF